MEKSKYIQPEISICHVETDQMMMVGSPIPPRFDDPADGDIEVLTNMEKFKDIWGNDFKVSHSKRNGTTRRFPVLGQSMKGCPFPYPDRSGKAEYSGNETIPQAIGLQNKLRT